MERRAQGRAVQSVGQAESSFPLIHKIAVVGAYYALATPATVFKLAHALAKLKGAVYNSAVMGQNGVAAADRIDALRQQRPHIRRIDVLNLVQQPGWSLDFAETHAKTFVGFVVRRRPIEGDGVAEIAQQKITCLDA